MVTKNDYTAGKFTLPLISSNSHAKTGKEVCRLTANCANAYCKNADTTNNWNICYEMKFTLKTALIYDGTGTCNVDHTTTSKCLAN